MFIHAPAVLENIIVEKFVIDATVVETLTFKNMSGISKQLYMINGVRVQLEFNIHKEEVRNYKSNRVDFD